MGINFPNSPAVGDLYPTPAVAGVPTYRWDGTAWVAGSGGAAGTAIYVSDTPPVGVPNNSLWWQSNSGNLFIQYNDGDSVQWVAVTSGSSAAPVALGQCALVKSGANLLLSPKNGNLLTINGVPCVIPSVGVTLAPTGLTVNTLYYIYATATAGAVTALEASTTGHSTSATAGNVGVEIKTGDDTRSLVGMVYTAAGPAFSDTATARWVRSWFNRTRMSLRGNILGANAALGTTMAEIGTNVRCNFVSWADDVVHFTNIFAYYTSAITSITAQLAYDGVAAGAGTIFNGDGTSRVLASAVADATYLAEGQHYVTVFALSNIAGGNAYQGCYTVGWVG